MEANALAYKSMNYAIYFGVAALIYASEAYLAIVVDDIGQVFGFIGTFAGTSLSYFIPSLLFCQAFSKFADSSQKLHYQTWFKISIVNGILGIFFFFVFLYANILSITN